MERIRQSDVEDLFSPENTHAMLRDAITAECDRKLLTWCLGCFLRIDDYLQGEYYQSKMLRIAEFKEHIEKVGLQSIISTVLTGVIKERRNPTLQRVVGYVGGSLPFKDEWDSLKTAAELISLCAGRIYSITRDDEEDNPVVEVHIWARCKEMFGSELDFIEDTHFHPPLIERPKSVTNRHTCGYHNVNVPVLLGRYTEHDNYLDLETLNILNQQEWEIDPEVLAEGEQPVKPIQSIEDLHEWQDHKAQSNRIYKMLGDKPFYLAWQYDSRGRMYSHGYHVNLQSHEFKKALLNPVEGEVVTC